MVSDHELENAVKRFSLGEKQFFDVIYDATKTPVYYTILSIVKNAADAEDLMQDTYLNMIEALPRYRGRGSFRGWLLTIARNLALNAYKKRKREHVTDPMENESMFGQVEPSQENRSYLGNLLESLSEDEREAVIRHVVLNQKHKDIARAMNKPLGTITWMYQNALKKMRKKAGEDDA